MTAPTIGSLCSGYGGLDLAIERFFGARTAWFSEFESAPSKVLEDHWPGVPNLGDMTKIDWASVEPVDIIAGGTPCQDLSAAGKRKGMTEGTRSNLWVQMREAVAVIRPSIVIWENVRGAFSAYATSEVESEPGLLGAYGPDRPALRALGRVLGDLSDLGYDTEWVGVRASDAGAPHGRFRVFVLAHTHGGRRGKSEPGIGKLSIIDSFSESIAPDTSGERLREYPGESSAKEAGATGSDLTDGDGGLRADSNGWPSTTNASSVRRDESDDVAGVGGEGADRASVVDERGARPRATEWGPYRPAIELWESVTGRIAPSATNPDGRDDSHRLAPEFVEWMMGLPKGHVTAPAIDLTRNQQLKALGNGVVPQQAELALSILWPRVLESLERAA